MTIRQALTILHEMQKWRRSEKPYDNTDKYIGLPYSPKEFGEAIDVAIDRMETELAFCGENEK